MVILIGSKDSKRTEFFMKAASQNGVPVRFIGWDSIIQGVNYETLQGAVVKIDPISCKITEFGSMQDSLSSYQHLLGRLGKCSCTYLNTPAAILSVLDKEVSKRILQENGICVTKMLAARPESAMHILDIMKESKAYSVFIKPVNYSGAAGVAAFRINPSNGRMKMYTSCRLRDGRLYNTKKLYVYEEGKEILDIIGKLVDLGIIVEKWHPKDLLNGKSYDLRVVYQFGRIEYIVVRQSDGPVTNLHLNNQAADIKELGLSGETMSGVEEICNKAVSLFDGLKVAGIDVMLDKGSRKPRIIEINGQGDLIYQDIFSENIIYKKQTEFFKSMDTGSL